MPGKPEEMADQETAQRRDTASLVGRGPGDRRGERRGDGPGGGERVTVNLSARAARALEVLTKLTNDSKTDIISRSLQVHAFIEEVTANGGSLYIQESADAPMQLVKIF